MTDPETERKAAEEAERERQLRETAELTDLVTDWAIEKEADNG